MMVSSFPNSYNLAEVFSFVLIAVYQRDYNKLTTLEIPLSPPDVCNIVLHFIWFSVVFGYSNVVKYNE